MTGNDLKQIGQLLDERFAKSESRFDQKLASTEKNLKIEIRNTEDKLRSEIKSTETKLRSEIKSTETKLRSEIKSSASMVMVETGQFIENRVLPLIEEKTDKEDIARLERKIERNTDMVFEHGSRIQAIEQIPVVAHTLKFKRSKK